MSDTTPAPEEPREYLIRKNGFWYRPNCRGYTTSAIQAGRYTMAEAEKFTHPNGPDGPRDGMHYVHEDEVNCEDLATVLALRAELDRLREALQWFESRRLDAIARARGVYAREDEEVLALCRKYGFGAVMDSAARQWARIPEAKGGAFFIGGCIGDTSAASALTDTTP